MNNKTDTIPCAVIDAISVMNTEREYYRKKIEKIDAFIEIAETFLTDERSSSSVIHSLIKGS